MLKRQQSDVNATDPVLSPRGALVGLALQTKYQTTQIEISNAINHWRFYQIFNIKPPRHKLKAPHTKVKPP